MGSKFQPFHDQLYNDKAIACHVEYDDREKEMENVTDCTALSSGWAWNIPLWNRIGVGYVYSSCYTNPEAATQEFYAYLKERFGRYPKLLAPQDIDIRHGKRENAWVKNVIGIGLSYAFIEPLESTGLMTTHENLIFLVDKIACNNNKINNFDRQSYNYSVDNLTEVMKNFIVLHWVLSNREDTPYWKSITNDVNIPLSYTDIKDHLTHSALVNTYSLMDSVSNSFFTPDKLAGALYLAAGMDARPLNPMLYNEKADDERRSTVEDIHYNYQHQKQNMLEWVKEQPSHYEYLKDNIYVESV